MEVTTEITNIKLTEEERTLLQNVMNFVNSIDERTWGLLDEQLQDNLSNMYDTSFFLLNPD